MGSDERTWNLENQVADEEDAGAHAEDFRRDPRQVGRHRELGIGKVDAVNAGDDRDEEDRQDDAPVAYSFETGKIDVCYLFHNDTSRM